MKQAPLSCSTVSEEGACPGSADGDSDEDCGANGDAKITGLRSVRKRARRPIADEVSAGFCMEVMSGLFNCWVSSESNAYAPPACTLVARARHPSLMRRPSHLMLSNHCMTVVP